MSDPGGSKVFIGAFLTDRDGHPQEWFLPKRNISGTQTHLTIKESHDHIHKCAFIIG